MNHSTTLKKQLLDTGDEAALIARARHDPDAFGIAIRTYPPDWSPDGQWLVYPAARDKSLRNSAIYALNVPIVLQNPEDAITFRLTEEDGNEINPQVSP